MLLKMKLVNAQILNGHFQFMKGDIEIEDGVIKQVAGRIPYGGDDVVIDCEGYTVIPGYVDIHIHGCAGTDTSDGTRGAIENMAKYLITKGVTSFCPTTMTTDRETIEAAVMAAKDCRDRPCEGARVVGVNMEGPFISPARKGAQKEEHIIRPDINFLRKLYDAGGEIIKLVDIAPEMDETGGFIEQASGFCTVSIAHTTADFAAAKEAFNKGITHATHLFNAMTGLSHREPGVVGAVFSDERVRAELICDGHHIHPAVLKIAFEILGDRAIIVSDSMRANGLPENREYDLGGQMVTVKEGKAVLSDGTLAGSVSNLHDEVKNLVHYGIPMERAVKAATMMPARAIGMQDEIGSIEAGKRADLVVLDEEMNIVAVYH